MVKSVREELHSNFNFMSKKGKNKMDDIVTALHELGEIIHLSVVILQAVLLYVL